MKIPVKTYLITFLFGYILYSVNITLFSTVTLAILLALILYPYFKYFKTRNIIIYITVFTCGILWGYFPELYVTKKYLPLNGSEYNGKAVINSYSEISNKRIAFRCKLSDGEFKGMNCYVISYDENCNPEIGDIITVNDAVIEFSPIQKIGESILYKGNYSSERTFLTSTFKKISVTDKSSSYKLIKNLYRIREDINSTLQTFLNKDSFLFVSGMLTGNKESGNDEFYDALTASGLSHIIVVSGLHFTLLISLLIYLLKIINMNELAVCITGVIFSVLIALFFGLTPSVIRALIMSLVYIINDYTLNDNQDSLQKVIATAVIMILANPFVIYDAGFVLSFTSILGIILFSKKLTLRIRYIPIKLSEAIAVTLAANILTFPVLIMYFGKASLTFAFGNLLVTPLVSPIMIYGITAVVLSMIIEMLAPYLFMPVNLIIGILLKIIFYISKLPFSNIKFIVPAIEIIILFYITVAVLARLRNSPKIYTAVSGALAILFLLNVFIPKGYLYGGKAEYYSLCGKQSGKVIINAGLSTAVVDFSSSSEYFDIASVLNKKSRGNVDVYIANTPEAIKALVKLKDRISLKKVMVPSVFLSHPPTAESLDELNCDIEAYDSGQYLKLGNIILTAEGENGYNIDMLKITRNDKELMVHGSWRDSSKEGNLNIYTYDRFRYMMFNNINIPENTVNNQYEDIVQGYL